MLAVGAMLKWLEMVRGCANHDKTAMPMGLLDVLFGRARAKSDVDPAPRARRAKANEHYLLGCRACGSTHEVPSAYRDDTTDWSVDVGHVRLLCVFGGGAFTVTLGVEDFFTIKPVPMAAGVLHASIAKSMRVLNRHMLSHCDPVFLLIRQTSKRTDHDYKRQPEGETYVKVSASHGVDIIGNINVSKAMRKRVSAGSRTRLIVSAA
jgi:hypothetical protein